jgi:hypothetical protein
MEQKGLKFLDDLDKRLGNAADRLRSNVNPSNSTMRQRRRAMLDIRCAS